MKIKKKSTIIEAIYAISRVYEYKIVAEGVETIDQLEYLKEIGIQICQGYLFDKPMPFHKLLEKSKVNSNYYEIRNKNTKIISF